MQGSSWGVCRHLKDIGWRRPMTHTGSEGFFLPNLFLIVKVRKHVIPHHFPTPSLAKKSSCGKKATHRGCFPSITVNILNLLKYKIHPRTRDSAPAEREKINL